MNITWIGIKNIPEYIRAMLTWQANDIPKELINRGRWVQEVIPINEINTEDKMVERHDHDPTHIRRRDSFIDSINSFGPLLPLIVLNCERGEKYLVDGYARYRALKKLGVERASVLRQVDI